MNLSDYILKFGVLISCVAVVEGDDALNQIDVIYVNLCLFNYFNTTLTRIIEFRAFGVDWG